MKKVIKIFTLALCIALMLSFSVTAFASEKSEGISESDVLPESTVTDGNEKGRFFEELYRAVEEHSAEILSALAFVGSLIIMLCYKRGLLPLISDGIKALKSGVKLINEKSDSFNEHAVGLCESIDTRLERAEKLSEAVLRSAENVENEIAEIQKNSAETERLKIILSSQIDMLYEIFMSASLPQYLKNSVGEKIGEMKSALGKEVEVGENS